MYDKDGIVDGYVEYLLSDLARNADDMVIMCNGRVGSKGMEVLKKYTGREN